MLHYWARRPHNTHVPSRLQCGVHVPAKNKRDAGDLLAIELMQGGIVEHLNSAEAMRYVMNCLKTLAEEERTHPIVLPVCDVLLVS